MTDQPDSKMPIRVVPIGYGPDAARELNACVTVAKQDDPLSAVTVVVPTNYVGVAARRRLASGDFGPVTAAGRGVAGVTFLTVYRLAELLGAAGLAAQRRRPVSTPVVAAALRAALAEEPGVFSEVAEHPATEEAFVGAFRELSDVSADAQAAIAARSPRARDVVRIVADARRRLEPAWYDEADLVAAAAEAARQSPVVDELGTVVLYLPQDLSRGGGQLMQVVAERVPMVVVAGRVGDDHADAAVAESLRRLGAESEQYLSFRSDASSVIQASPEILTASDAEDEVRGVVRRIVEAARDGIPLERIAVLYGTREPYARLLHEHFRAAGIPYNGTAVRPASEMVAGRVLLDALGLLEGGMRRQDVMSLLCGAPIRDKARFAPSSAWERASREAGIISGDDWDLRLGHHIQRLDAEAAAREDDPDSSDWQAERPRREAERARGLQDFMGRLRGRLVQGQSLGTWAELAAWATSLLHELLGEDTARHSWPAEERRAAEKVEAALGRLGHLDTVAGGADVEVFTRTLELELDSDLGRTGRLGQGVLVGPVRDGVGLDMDLVGVLGLAEGSLPTRPAEDSLLSESDRSASHGELALRGERVHAEHRLFRAATASAGKVLHLSCPRGDLRKSNERIASRWLLDIVEARTGERPASDALASSGLDWVHHCESFASGVARVPFPATEQEYRVRALSLDPAEPPDSVVAAAFETVAARSSSGFTRFDGNLSGLAVPSPLANVVSPTRLEDYAGCPHGYLLGTLLRVRVVEDPEEQLTMSALDYGKLVHEVLERFVEHAIAGGAVPDPTEPWAPGARKVLRDLFDQVAAGYEAAGLCGRAPYWRRDKRRLMSDLERFADADDTRRRILGCRPVATEASFGRKGPAVRVALPGGGVVALAGTMDRIDETADGSLVVTDYKTGGWKRYKDLCAENSDADGTKLQLPVYALAARVVTGRPDVAVEAAYWFVTTKGEFKVVGYSLTPDITDRFAELLEKLTQLIAGGAFPSRGHATSYSGFTECPYCDPDGLGATELIRMWERKRNAPELDTYRDLYEPDAGKGAT